MGLLTKKRVKQMSLFITFIAIRQENDFSEPLNRVLPPLRDIAMGQNPVAFSFSGF